MTTREKFSFSQLGNAIASPVSCALHGMEFDPVDAHEVTAQFGCYRQWPAKNPPILCAVVRLEHGAPYADQPSGRCAAYGVVPAHPGPGLIFHSDQGSQYCSHEFQSVLTRYDMRSAISRKGNCWDNAPTDSLWDSLKVGRLHGMRSESRRQAMVEVIDWFTFYNHKRLYSTLGYISPMQFEID